MSLCAQAYSRSLRVQPTTPENKLKLVEEIKSRAKGCIGSRSFPVAIQLYTKAIDVLADGTDSAASAILRANRSMCYLSINNAALALEDASEAEKLDPTYIKTFYRKAAALKALGRFAEAKEAIQRGLHAKPDDKEMQGLLTKIKADLASKGSASASASGSSASAVKPARTTVKTGTSGSSSTAATKPSVSANKGSETSSADNAEEDDDENLGDEGKNAHVSYIVHHR
jgi:small glutamine-rich tetratricopeptide repeat-containing protein alpha